MKNFSAPIRDPSCLREPADHLPNLDANSAVAFPTIRAVGADPATALQATFVHRRARMARPRALGTSPVQPKCFRAVRVRRTGRRHPQDDDPTGGRSLTRGSHEPKVNAALALLTLSLSILGGCVSIDPPPEGLAERHVGRPERFRSEQAADDLVIDGEVLTGWLDDFNAPILEALVLETWERNPDLYVAAARFEEAAARLRITASLLYTRANAFGSARHTDTDGDSDNFYRLGLGVAWEIDLWGRLRADRSAAGNIALAAGLDFVQARHSLAAAVAEAYFAVLAAEGQLAIDRDLLDAERFTAQTTRQRVVAGLGITLDENLADSNVAQAEASIEGDLAALREAQRALELLLGRYPAAEFEVNGGVLPRLPEGPVAVSVPSVLLERRPDVRAAARLVDAAYFDVERARAARLPSLTLSADVMTAIDPADLISNLTADVLAPLFTGGRLQSEQVAANARQRQALGSFASIALRAFREVENALTNERHLAKREAHLSEASTLLRQASATAQSRYEQGLMQILDLQQIRRVDFLVRSQLLAVRFDQLRQRLDLYLALGGSVTTAAPDRDVIESEGELLDKSFVSPDRVPFGGELGVGQPYSAASRPESNRD